MARPIPAEILADGKRAKIFFQLVGLLGVMTNAQLREVAHSAGVSPQTLHNWVFGDTMNPHINTLVKVAHVLGFDIVLRKRSGRLGLRLAR